MRRLGLGDADLLMMAGAFLGWQIVVLAMFVGSFAALVLKILESFPRFSHRALRHPQARALKERPSAVHPMSANWRSRPVWRSESW